MIWIVAYLLLGVLAVVLSFWRHWDKVAGVSFWGVGFAIITWFPLLLLGLYSYWQEQRMRRAVEELMRIAALHALHVQREEGQPKVPDEKLPDQQS